MDKCALRRIEVNIAETKGREKVVAPSSWINVSDWNVQPTTAQVRLFSDGSAENQSNLVTRGGQVFRTSPWQRFLSVILEVEKMLSCIGFKNYIFQFVCAWVKSRERIIHNVSSSQTKSWPWRGRFFSLVRGPLAEGRAWAQKCFYFVIKTGRTGWGTFRLAEIKIQRFIFSFFI